MQICTLTQTQPRQHPTTQFFRGQVPFLPPNQQRQSTDGTKNQPTNKLKRYWAKTYTVGHKKHATFIFSITVKY